MRIHTTATTTDLAAAARAAGVYIHVTEHASRRAPRAFEVGLEGSGGRTNSGRYGAGERDGATWDEWGVFFANLYQADPKAECGGSAKTPVYRNADHYHHATGERFANLTMPADTHKRHRWQATYPVHVHGWHCTRCTATRPYGA